MIFVFFVRLIVSFETNIFWKTLLSLDNLQQTISKHTFACGADNLFAFFGDDLSSFLFFPRGPLWLLIGVVVVVCKGATPPPRIRAEERTARFQSFDLRLFIFFWLFYGVNKYTIHRTTFDIY